MEQNVYRVNRRETKSGACNLGAMTINAVRIRTTVRRVLGLCGGVEFVMPCVYAPADANCAVSDLSIVTYIVFPHEHCWRLTPVVSHIVPPTIAGPRVTSANFAARASMDGRIMEQ